MELDDPTGGLWRQDHAHRRPLAHEADALGRLVDVDHDPAETDYYEAMADSDAQAIDNAQRSYAGQYLRRLRRLRQRPRRSQSHQFEGNWRGSAGHDPH